MTAPTRAERQRRLAAASLLVMAALLLHNLAWSIRNQAVLSCTQTVCRSSTELGQLARDSPYPEIWARLAVLYWLRDRIGGATLTIPASLESLAWELEHVARLRVVVDDRPPALEPAPAGPGAESRPWRDRGTLGTLQLRRDPAAAHYVWSERGEGVVLVMPAEAR